MGRDGRVRGFWHRWANWTRPTATRASGTFCNHTALLFTAGVRFSTPVESLYWLRSAEQSNRWVKDASLTVTYTNVTGAIISDVIMTFMKFLSFSLQLGTFLHVDQSGRIPINPVYLRWRNNSAPFDDVGTKPSAGRASAAWWHQENEITRFSKCCECQWDITPFEVLADELTDHIQSLEFHCFYKYVVMKTHKPAQLRCVPVEHGFRSWKLWSSLKARRNQSKNGVF